MAKFFSIENARNVFNSVKEAGAEAAERISGAMKLTYPASGSYDNGAALTPPMGWSSWNIFRNHINEDLIVETAEAIKKSGLADCGYIYVNLDDCWMASSRDENGKLCADPVSFPSGIPALVEKINSLGLKAGIYSDNGTLTCEKLPASLGHEAEDADTFAEWGIEYLKYDFGNNIPVPAKAPDIVGFSVKPTGSDTEEFYSAEQAELMGSAAFAGENGAAIITGLSFNKGSCEFSGVNSPEAGEAEICLNLKYKTGTPCYIEILVNRLRRYRVKIPAGGVRTPDGNIHFRAALSKGENVFLFYNPIASRIDSTAMQYIDMGAELKRATRTVSEKNGTPEKKIVYSICEWGSNLPWKWAPCAGNLWRTTPDIRPAWYSIVGIYEVNVLLAKYASPGAWNDPDMLEVGNGKLTFEENKSHFTLWCMMAAPLILGNDVRKFILPDGTVDSQNNILKILTNKEMIAINQDPLGVQCRRFRTNGAEDILIKPLENGDAAVCFFNKAPTPTRMSASVKEIICDPIITAPMGDDFEYTDLWSGEKGITDNILSASVPAHGVKAFRIKVK